MPTLILLNGPPASGESHDRFVQFLETRPTARRITVVRGDVESALRLLEAAADA